MWNCSNLKKIKVDLGLNHLTVFQTKDCLREGDLVGLGSIDHRWGKCKVFTSQGYQVNEARMN